MVEFEVKVIEENDYKAINAYLEHYVKVKSIFDSRQLADIILKQDYIGSSIHQEDYDDCFGFISAVNLKVHSSELCIVQIQNYIVNSAPPSEKNHWDQLVHGERVGLLISERIVNVPHGLAPGLHQSIFEEIQWAIEDGYSFEFDNIIYITMYAHDDPEGMVIKQNKKFKKDPGKKNWLKVEDSVYLKHASHHFSKAVNHSETKLIMQIPMSSIPSLLKDINQLIQENYSW